MQELLLIPGPVAVAPDVLAAAAQPITNHRGPAAAKLYARLSEQLQEVLRTRRQVLLLGSSGTGALEAAIVNCFSPGDKLLAMPMGAFGARLVAIARAYGADVEVIQTEWGQPCDPAVLRARLAADPRGAIKGVLLTHNETSTGVLNDLAALARARGDHPALLIVDTVSGAGAADLETDQSGLDVVVSASQKALAGVPGAAFIALSERAWQAAQTARMPRFYFDLAAARAAAAKGQTPWTPPLGVLLALERAADNYLKEGREAAFARHGAYAAAIRAGCEALGLRLFAHPGAYSPTVTAVRAPDGIDVRMLQRHLRERYGVVVAGGQQKLEGAIFRIGNMGALAQRDILGAVAALELALSDLGAPVSAGDAAGAAARAISVNDALEERVQAGVS